MSMFSPSCPDHNCITDAHKTNMEVFKQSLLVIRVMPRLAIFRIKSHDCGHSCEVITNCVDASTLTETAVIGEVSQEVVTFLSLTPTDWAGAPWSHAGCWIVHVVGSNCTAWRQKAHRSQAPLNIHSPLELLHCVLNALLFEWMVMDTAFPLYRPELIEFQYSWVNCVCEV